MTNSCIFDLFYVKLFVVLVNYMICQEAGPMIGNKQINKLRSLMLAHM